METAATVNFGQRKVWLLNTMAALIYFSKPSWIWSINILHVLLMMKQRPFIGVSKESLSCWLPNLDDSCPQIVFTVFDSDTIQRWLFFFFFFFVYGMDVAIIGGQLLIEMWLLLMYFAQNEQMTLYYNNIVKIQGQLVNLKRIQEWQQKVEMVVKHPISFRYLADLD